ncbi:uncharacterized protein LOC111008913 [Momordica charantia]|uniref:Uncharacterized protein LOC111008913 n=1 Tax=Momordica charantia TaxID=3673 RepID=A0A6J1CAG5_MOMCH|nr:uncharacterized protein LOC111008913 [Momordica charantia]
MAAPTPLLRLLVIFLGFCSLLSSNAVPTSRSVSLIHGADQFLQVSSKTHMVSGGEEEVKHGRMVVALNDYPGSGANNRHTPRPQFRGCADC